jgi:hypothetical protein
MRAPNGEPGSSSLFRPFAERPDTSQAHDTQYSGVQKLQFPAPPNLTIHTGRFPRRFRWP